MFDFLKAHAGWLFAVSIVTFAVTLVVLPWLIVRMAPDYFVRSRRPPAPGPEYAIVRWAGRAAKNALGLVLVLAGIVLSVPFVPGQGLLTLLIGLGLLDFPGKRRIELRIVRLRHVRQGIDWIRARAGRPALIIPDE